MKVYHLQCVYGVSVEGDVRDGIRARRLSDTKAIRMKPLIDMRVDCTGSAFVLGVVHREVGVDAGEVSQLLCHANMLHRCNVGDWLEVAIGGMSHSMAEKNPNRDAAFPAIEKKHGQPMQVWFDVFAEYVGKPYLSQVAVFRESHGFSQAHASAVVLFCRGSTTSRRYEDLDGYLEEHFVEKQALVRKIYGVIMTAHPELEQVIAWNQPMVKFGREYIFGLSVAKNHVLIAPFNSVVLEEFLPRLTALNLNKKTIQVPLDWDVDEQLLVDMVGRGIELVSE